MIRPNIETVRLNFRRQVSIPKMPSEAYELIRHLVSDFDNRFRGSLNLDPSSVFKLQTISVCHRNRFWKFEKNLFPMIHR